MEILNFKLLSLEIENVKNVDYGKIDFTSKNEALHVVGIYGQNGSGKTTVIECMDLVRTLLLGDKLEDEVFDLVDVDRVAEINVQFDVNHEQIIEYKVSLTKIKVKEDKIFEKKQKEKEKIVILKESLRAKKVKKNAQFFSIIEYEKIDDESLKLAPKYRFPMTTANIKKFFVAEAIAEETGCSFIFSENMNAYMNDLDDEIFQIYQIMRRQLPPNIFIYTNRVYGMINANLLMHFLFAYKTENGQVLGMIPVDISKSDSVSPTHYRVLESVAEQINMVLPAIVPGIQVKFKELGRGLNNDGEEVVNVEFVSSRDGKEFPFRCESDGIKKIVSILSSIINMYGIESTIVLIDELDSGIYEYLLGEIIEILDKNAKGQLVFTSHNLRPLEVLKDQEIIFTTVNKGNRYVRSQRIKATNNLRNVYLRKIQVGGDEDKLYDETDSFLIKKNLRLASKIILSADENDEVALNDRK